MATIFTPLWNNSTKTLGEVRKDRTYGFRLRSADALVAIGEAAWPSKSPFVYGEEWSSNNIENKDHYYRYFSLAFKVDLRA